MYGVETGEGGAGRASRESNGGSKGDAAKG